MKKLVKFAIATTLAVALVGCGAKPADSGTAAAGGEEEITDFEAVMGGWEVSEDGASSLLTPEEATIFQQAMGDLLGVSYEPVCVIGKQVVAGTNYAYLCRSTVVAPDAKPEWTVVVIYVDLDGNASFTTANAIDLADLHLVGEKAGVAFGAWEVPATAEPAPLPADVLEAVDAFVAEGGYELQPQALLGSQVVAGTNYQVLCIGHETADGAPEQVYDVMVYVDLDGTAEVVSVDALDIVHYVTPVEAEE